MRHARLDDSFPLPSILAFVPSSVHFSENSLFSVEGLETTMTRLLRVLDVLYLPALIVAGAYLYQKGPQFFNAKLVVTPFIYASALLLLGFVLRSLYWHLLLHRFGFSVPISVSVASQLKPVLLKFIPGKVFSFAGRTAILAEFGSPLGSSAILTVLAQILNIYTGVILGLLGIVLFDFFYIPPVVYFAIAIFSIPAILSLSQISVPQRIRYFRIRGRHFKFPEQIPKLWDLLLLSICCWLLIGSSFWMFFLAIGLEPGFMPVLLQPAANSMGMLTVITPSGIGVREAVTVWYLTMAEIPVAAAISASITARFWTVAVEIVGTAIGALCHRIARHSHTT